MPMPFSLYKLSTSLASTSIESTCLLVLTTRRQSRPFGPKPPPRRTTSAPMLWAGEFSSIWVDADTCGGFFVCLFVFYSCIVHSRRLLMVYPQTKTYFSHWNSLSPNSEDVKKHGAAIMNGVTEAIGKIDNLTTGLLNLSELHAFNLRVDPGNFKVYPRWSLTPTRLTFCVVFKFSALNFTDRSINFFSPPFFGSSLPTASLWSWPTYSPRILPLRSTWQWTSSWQLWPVPCPRSTGKSASIGSSRRRIWQLTFSLKINKRSTALNLSVWLNFSHLGVDLKRLPS